MCALCRRCCLVSGVFTPIIRRSDCVLLPVVSVLLQLLWCWRVGWQDVCTVQRVLLAWGNILHTVHTSCHPTLQHHNSYNRTEHRQWNAVRPPDDGRKDSRNMLRNNLLPINHYLLHLVGSRLYLINVVVILLLYCLLVSASMDHHQANIQVVSQL
jgi:hypothetical protein